MADLTEREIFDCLSTHFREAEVLCTEMATNPIRGARYKRLIQVCKLIEGACRQAGHWREHYVWFDLGNDVHKLQAMIGDWLRRYVGFEEKRTQKARDLFRKAAETMSRLKRLAEVTRDRKTGRVGQILPVAAPGPMRQRAVQVPAGFKSTSSGLLVPA